MVGRPNVDHVVVVGAAWISRLAAGSIYYLSINVSRFTKQEQSALGDKELSV